MCIEDTNTVITADNENYLNYFQLKTNIKILRESKSVNLSLAVFFFVTCYAIPVVHNISPNLNSTLLILCEFMITLKYYTPYSKMAANKLFFCLHVN